MMSNHYKGAAIPDIARLAALNDDLTCDIWHPRNAAYRVPLADADNEAMANAMADAIIGAVAAEHADDEDFDFVKALDQALVDARRMVCDPEYARLFVGKGAASFDEVVVTHSARRYRP